MIAINHTKYLDGFRGITALLVVFGHFESFWGVFTSGASTYSQSSIWWRLYNSLCNGNFYVCIFFVLSGMVLINKFHSCRDVKVLQVAFIKRYFRLTPVVLSSLLLVWILNAGIGFHNVEMGHIVGHTWLADQYTKSISFFNIVYNGILGVYRGDTFYNGPLWTISIELIGSFILFLFSAMFYNRANFLCFSCLLSFFLVYIIGEYGVYFSLFVFGANIVKLDFSVNKYLFIPAIYLGGLEPWSHSILWLASCINLDVNKLTVITHAVAAILLVTSIKKNYTLISILQSKIFAWLGKISFCMYVYHVPIIMSIGCLVYIYFYKAGLGEWSAIIAMSTSYIIIFTASWIGFKYIDVVGQTLSSKVAQSMLR